jgi:hypothetical protein
MDPLSFRGDAFVEFEAFVGLPLRAHPPAGSLTHVRDDTLPYGLRDGRDFLQGSTCGAFSYCSVNAIALIL